MRRWGVEMGFIAGIKMLLQQLRFAISGKGIPLELATKGTAVVEMIEVEIPVDDDPEMGEVIAATVEVEPLPARADPVPLESLEALRFGLVPEGHVQRLTLGYERLAKWAKQCFPHTNGDTPNAYEITGPFGTGKSHTMSVIRYLAGNEGYLTARVEIDGHKISLADPDQLLYALWSTLKGSGLVSDTPLLDLYLMAIQNGYEKAPAPLHLSKLFAINYETILTLEKLGLADKHALLIEEALSSSDAVTTTRIKDEISQEDNIKRSEIRLKALKSKTKEDRPRNFIESLAGHALIAKAAGYKGLVITIDEFEVEYTRAQSGLAQVEELVSRLAAYLVGSTDLPIAPLAIFFATVGQDGHRGDILIGDLITRSGGDTFALAPWAIAQRVELAHRIFSLYQQAYGLQGSFDPELAQDAEDLLVDSGHGDSDLIRMYIKWYLALLDLKYGPGRHQNEHQSGIA